MIEFTVFENLFDNKTHRRISVQDWDAFVQVLFDLSTKPVASKKDAQLISPAIYQPDSTRKNDTVIEWAGWCAVDVDDFEFEGDLKDVLVQRFGHYTFVCYSTASSTRTSPKFRIIFPLSSAVDKSRIRNFWFALNTELKDIGDKQTKDLSRMYYIPAQYSGAFNFIFHHTDGEFVCPDLLINKYPMAEKTGDSFFDKLPEQMKKEILEYRKNKLDQQFEWSSYRDCPFWPKQLAAEYQTISKTGWYHKMYQIMVAIAGNATKNKYAISSDEISQLCRQFDNDTGKWYENRPIDKEADRALEYVYKNL